jgi:chemotaxis protein methyltransferase CheR
MSGETQEFEYLRQLVYKHTAIVLEPGQSYLVDARVGEIARHAGYPSAIHLLARLRQEPFHTLHRRVVEAMTTNETMFFRDITPYDALRKSVLPALIARPETERRLTIWCAACSTGQEPYSLAMLLQEHFPDYINKWPVRIVASDVAREVLDRARAGTYSQLEINRGLPVQLLVKYFRQSGKEWQINESIRKMVEFRELNLAQVWEAMPSVDIVMLRNVLIYFNVETKKDILRKVRQLLRPKGYLFLGTAETTLNLDANFAQQHSDRTTYFHFVPKT